MSDYDYLSGISTLPKITYRREISKLNVPEAHSVPEASEAVNRALRTQEAPTMSKLGPAAIAVKPLLSLSDTLALESQLKESFNSRPSRSAIQKMISVRSEIYNPVLVPTEGHRYPTVEQDVPLTFHRVFLNPLARLLSSHRKEDIIQGIEIVSKFSLSFHNLTGEHCEADHPSVDSIYQLGSGLTQSLFEGLWFNKVIDHRSYVLDDFALGDCITLHILYLLLDLLKRPDLDSEHVLSLLRSFKQMLKSPNFLAVIELGVNNFDDFDFFTTLLSLKSHHLESLDLLSMLLPRFPHPKLVTALLTFLAKSDIQGQQYVLTVLKALFCPVSPVGDLFCVSSQNELLKSYIFSRDDISEVLIQLKNSLEQRNFQELIFGSLVYFMSTSLPHSITFISFLTLSALENSHELLLARLISARESVFVYGSLIHSLIKLGVNFPVEESIKEWTILLEDFTVKLPKCVSLLMMEFNQTFVQSGNDLEELIMINLSFLSESLASLLTSFWLTIGNDMIRVSEHILSYHDDQNLRNSLQNARIACQVKQEETQ